MTTGADLRALRESAGISLTRMAERTHFAKSYLSMVETGKRDAKAVVAAYEQALGTSLSPPPTDPLRLAHEWLVTESPMVVHARAGRRVGETLAAALESRVIELRHLDDVVSSADLHPVVSRELAEAEALVRAASCTEDIRRRLLVAVGELAQLAGWITSDAGKFAEAQRHYIAGVSAAAEARDRVLGAQLLSSLSYQIANVGNPSDAALLARTALAGATAATPLVRALLLERVAWASAKSADHAATRRTLDQVDDTYARRGPDEPEWVYWLDRNEIDVMAGRCLIELGQPGKAEPLLANAISNYPPEHAREVALYLSWLAESFARTGNADAAHATLATADDYAATMPSARTAARLAAVRRLLTGPGTD